MVMKMVCFDGYMLGLGIVEIVIYQYIGIVDFFYEDFILIVLLNFDYVVFIVNNDVFWEILDEVLNDFVVLFNEFMVFGLVSGVVYYFLFVGFLDQQFIDLNIVNLVFSEGVVFGFQEFVVGGVDIVFLLFFEIDFMCKFGCVCILVVFVNECQEFFLDVLVVKEIIGDNWFYGFWCGFVGFKGLLEDVCQ